MTATNSLESFRPYLRVASEQRFLDSISSLHPRSPLDERPKRIYFITTLGTNTPVEDHGVVPFFSPFNARDSAEFASAVAQDVILGETERFFRLFSDNTRAVVRLVLLRAINERYASNPPAVISRSDLVAPLERVVADLHMRWSSDSDNLHLGVARAILWFFLDILSYPGIQVLLENFVDTSVVRALIERDPVFSDRTDLSTRQVNFEQVCRPFQRQDRPGIFQLLAEQSILQRWTTRGSFDHADVVLARNLLEEYAVGRRTMFSAIPTPQFTRLCELGFIVPTPDQDGHSMELKQAQIDRAWLTECLTRIFASSVNVARGHTRNGRRYCSAEDLQATAAVCSLICYNSCATGDRVMDRFAQQCRYVHSNPFAPWSPPEIGGNDSATKANIFLIRSAHFSTIANLTAALRAMYSDGTDGAPYYARVASHKRAREDPPRLVIELDPMFSSELLVWLEGYRVGLSQSRPGTVFHCIVSDQGYDPYAVINDPSASPKSSFAAIMALGNMDTSKENLAVVRDLTVTWLSKHTKTTNEACDVNPCVYETVGEWLVDRRVAHPSEEVHSVCINSQALEVHGERWRLALYIFTQATQHELFIRAEDRDALVCRLLGVMPVVA